MTGSPTPLEETLVDNKNNPTQSLPLGHYRHGTTTNGNPTGASSNGGGSSPMAWDLPPLVASPNSNGGNELWKTRSCKIITPQRLGTILLLSNHDEEEQQQLQHDSSLLESELSDYDPDDTATTNTTDPHAELAGTDSFGSPLPVNDHLPTGGASSPSQLLQSTRKLADTTPCSYPPLLWKGEYILVPMITGKIQMYRLYDDEPVTSYSSTSTMLSTSTTITSPISSLTLPSDATIVAMKELDKDSTTGIILLLSGEGQIHHIQIEEHNSGTSLVLEQSWDTGSCGASCLTVIAKNDSTTGTTGTADPSHYYILIGYTTGQIESYLWQREQQGLVDHGARGGGGSGPRPRRAGRAKRRKPSSCWKGWMEEWHAVESMQILSCPTSPSSSSTATASATASATVAAASTMSLNPQQEANNQEKSKADPTTSTTTTRNDESIVPILLVTLQPSIGDDENPPLIQALDLNAIHTYAANAATTRSSTTSTSTPSVHDENDGFLVLEQFRLLPDPAMGILEASSSSASSKNASLPSYLPHKLHAGGIPSQGTNQILPLSGKCGVALSNGTIAIVSPGWGVENDHDQIQLSYPAIGLGTFCWKEREYLACCLRAGTTYLIPTSPASTPTTTTATMTMTNSVMPDNPSEIPVVLYPHDIDTDTTHLYVQSFTAGSLRIPGHPSLMLPVLVYVFPGGVIDIYSCHLLPCSIISPSTTSTYPTQRPPLLPSADEEEEDQVLEAMIQDGCLDMVLQVFDQNLAKNDTLWNDAKQEWQTLVRTNSEDYRSDIVSPLLLQRWKDYPALRNLLLHLATI